MHFTISCISWQIIVSARAFLLTYEKFRKIYSFVPANYRLTGHKISIKLLSELLSKKCENKEQNLRISLALLLHNTVLLL